MVKNLKPLPSIEAFKAGALNNGGIKFPYKDGIKDGATVLTLTSGMLDPKKQRELQKDGRLCCCFLEEDGHDCDFVAETRVDLARHEMTHCDGGYQCPACSREFKQKSQLKTHYASVHEKTAVFACQHTDCERTFTDQSSACRHEKLHAGLGDIEHTYYRLDGTKARIASTRRPHPRRPARPQQTAAARRATRARAGPTAEQQMQPTMQQELPAFGSLSGASFEESQPLTYFGQNGFSGGAGSLQPTQVFNKSCVVPQLSPQQVMANKVSSGGYPMLQDTLGGFGDSNFDAMDNFPFGNQPQHQFPKGQWLYSSSNPQQNSSHNPEPPLFVEPQELEFNSWHGAAADVCLELNNSPQWDPNLQASYTNGTGSDAPNAQAAINATRPVDNSAGSAYPVDPQEMDPDLLDLDNNVPISTGPSLPLATESIDWPISNADGDFGTAANDPSESMNILSDDMFGDHNPKDQFDGFA